MALCHFSAPCHSYGRTVERKRHARRWVTSNVIVITNFTHLRDQDTLVANSAHLTAYQIHYSKFLVCVLLMTGAVTYAATSAFESPSGESRMCSAELVAYSANQPRRWHPGVYLAPGARPFQRRERWPCPRTAGDGPALGFPISFPGGGARPEGDHDGTIRNRRMDQSERR